MADVATKVPIPGTSEFITFPAGVSDEKINEVMRGIVAERGMKPPPGVTIHEANRSYVTPLLDFAGSPMGEAEARAATGQDRIGWALPGETPPSVTTTGMSQPQRAEAAAALNLRRGGMGIPRLATPALQGATLNYADEIASLGAGAGSMARGGEFGSTFNLMQEAQRQELTQARQEYPVTSGALQVGGGLATVPYLGLLGAPGAAATGAVPLGGRMLGGAGAGALYGGAAGFGEGSGLKERLTDAGIGATLGAVAGAAVPAVAESGRAIANRIFDSRTINRELERMGVGRPAGDATMRMLQADDAFTGAGRANMLAAGPNAMLADVGPSTQGLLDMAIQRGGGGSNIARQAIEMRGSAANQTLTDALNVALGGAPRGVGAMTSEISQAGQAGRRTVYDAAYAAPIDYSSREGRELESIFRQAIPKSVIDEANLIMQVRREPPSAQLKGTVAADGTVTFERLPDVRQLDYITRALRTISESGATTGALGKATPKSQSFADLASDIRRTMRTAVPEYATALDTAADDIGRIQATRLGSELLSPSMTRDEVAQALGRHQNSAAEMEQVRRGVRSGVDDLMARVRAIATDPNQDAREAAAALKTLNSREAQDKLDMVVTDPLIRRQLEAQIEEASRAIMLRANLTTNSKTFARTAQQQATQQMIEPGVLGTLAKGQPINATQRAVQLLTGRTPAYDIGREDLMNRQIAELLTSAGPAAQRNLGLLGQAYTQAPQNVARAENVGGWAGLLTGLPGYQTGRELLRGLLP